MEHEQTGQHWKALMIQCLVLYALATSALFLMLQLHVKNLNSIFQFYVFSCTFLKVTAYQGLLGFWNKTHELYSKSGIVNRCNSSASETEQVLAYLSWCSMF